MAASEPPARTEEAADTQLILCPRIDRAPAGFPIFSPDAGMPAWSGLTSLPVELLQMVFVETINSYDSAVGIADEAYDKERAVAPFVLSAVCQRWRTTAVHTPELWSYLAIPPIDSPCEALVPFTERLLKLSSRRPIHLFVHSDSLRAIDWLWKSVVSLAAVHYPRWKRARVVIPPIPQDPSLSFLQQRNPILEDLFIDWMAIHGHGSQYPAVALDAPKLRHLHGSVRPLDPRSRCRSLIVAGMTVDLDEGPTMIEILRHATQLKELSLTGVFGVYHLRQAADAVRLAHLSSMTIWSFDSDVYFVLSALEMPALRRLVLGKMTQRRMTVEGWSNHSLWPFMKDRFPNLDQVEFDSSADTRDAPWTFLTAIHVAEACFPTAKRLVFIDYAFSKLDDYGLLPSLPAGLALESVTLRGRSSFTPFDVQSLPIVLSRIAIWSHEASPDRSAFPAPFRLYIEDLDPVPVWVCRASTRVLGPDNCRFIDKDGHEILSSASDDEAEYTDSDSDSDSAESEASSSESERDEFGEDGPVVTLDGPDWATDDSEDDGWTSEDVSAEYELEG
ncbi:hypothetical protein AURDEDRAFT_160178 [Auricularia subglabra TFB-10046 SS5]|nr:hypothetical protein AURDEDRAFT_160178 [Auricularia subglabra TFB-10046 SS5]